MDSKAFCGFAVDHIPTSKGYASNLVSHLHRVGGFVGDTLKKNYQNWCSIARVFPDSYTLIQAKLQQCWILHFPQYNSTASFVYLVVVLLISKLKFMCFIKINYIWVGILKISNWALSCRIFSLLSITVIRYDWHQSWKWKFLLFELNMGSAA